jgi:hypothetical protein
MALQARLLVQQSRIHHPRPVRHPVLRRKRPVRIVTIGAVHEALVYPVAGGHFKLRPDIRVAAVAKLRLLFRQQKLGSGGMVYRMATGTRHIVLSVFAPPDIGLVEVAGVARQAGLHHRLGRHQRKRPRDGGLAAPCLHVCPSRPVTPFAPRPLGTLLAGRDALIVRILVEVEPHIRMASLAHVAAHVAGLRRLRTGAAGQQQE